MQTFTRRRFLEGSAGSVAAVSLGMSSLYAQDWAREAVNKSPRRREWVSVKHEARSVESVVAYPQSRDKAPAMVIIHEIFGMSDWVEKVTDEFAEAGFVAIAPDLLSGMAPNGGRTKDFPTNVAPPANSPAPPGRGGAGGFGPVGQAIINLPPDQITADLDAVADYVRKLPACNGKVCVVGFSWGGGQAFHFATTRKDLSAAFVCYGTGPAPEAISTIQAPIYGFYAGNDARVNGTIPQTQEQMKAAGKLFEPVIYEGAAHGFMRSGEQPNATDADRKAREAAWVKIRELKAKYK
jgi:carboxymethylenebutenolidase